MNMKVAIVSGASKKLDSVRGIGVHTNEIIKGIHRISKDIKVDLLEMSENFSKYDVVHFTSFRPFFISLPFQKPRGTKFVITIHDLIQLIYPKVYKPGIKGSIKFFINKILIKKYVDKIITISETSKKDICRFLAVDPDIVKVIYLAPKSEYKPISKQTAFKIIKKFNLPEKFVFYYGDINYNKNINVLIKACELLDIKLVIAGKQALEIETMDLKHPENMHLLNLNLSNVIRLGYVSDEEANAILNSAICLVQPSLYEGFGLSVLHAMASGCPVIVSKTQALVEIGGDACLVFNPNSSIDLSIKIKEVIENKKMASGLVSKGYLHAKKFNWETAALETLAVYEKK